jgi:hypothetical protein
MCNPTGNKKNQKKKNQTKPTNQPTNHNQKKKRISHPPLQQPPARAMDIAGNDNSLYSKPIKRSKASVDTVTPLSQSPLESDDDQASDDESPVTYAVVSLGLLSRGFVVAIVFWF